ncbi:MAG: hypothetical protein R2822_28575 [Spirosomataceae bacterium]
MQLLFLTQFRLATSFPGVVAANDRQRTRDSGQRPRGTQWRLEGVEIVNPNHSATKI